VCVCVCLHICVVKLLVCLHPWTIVSQYYQNSKENDKIPNLGANE